MSQSIEDFYIIHLITRILTAVPSCQSNSPPF